VAALTQDLGPVTWDGYGFAACDKVLDDRLAAAGERLYSAAYIMPPPRLGEPANTAAICG
jgi:hypothetical protein